MMRRSFLCILFPIGFSCLVKAQTTCLPCDQLGMTVNVGSDTNSLSIYHSGQYLTHPQEHNIFDWSFTDLTGNVIYQNTLVDNAFCNFSHNFPISDTMNVIVYLTNDFAILPNGNSINCYFEDQIYWETGLYPSGTPWGRWAFIHGNVGVDLNDMAYIEEINPSYLHDNKFYDLLGRELKEAPKGQLYIQNGKKIFRIDR